jgi:hypothetical protein
VLLISKNGLQDSSVLNSGKIDSPLLLLGLVYREVCRSMEIEPGVQTNAPEHLVNSTFGARELSKISSLLKKVVIP